MDGPGTHLLSTLEVASWRVFKSGSHHFLSFPLVLACCLELNPLAHSGRPLFNHHLGILYQSHQWPRRGEENVSNVRSKPHHRHRHLSVLCLVPSIHLHPPLVIIGVSLARKDAKRATDHRHNLSVGGYMPSKLISLISKFIQKRVVASGPGDMARGWWLAALATTTTTNSDGSICPQHRRGHRHVVVNSSRLGC